MTEPKTPAMKRWRWVNLNPTHGKHQGYLWAATEEEAFSLIQQQKLVITHLYLAPMNPLERIRSRITPQDITYLTRQIATMLSAEFPLPDALSLLAAQSQKPVMQRLLRSLHGQVAQGMSVAESFENTSAIFNPVYISLIRAGEAAGQLDKTFEQLAHYQERKEHIRAKTVKAAIYPCVVIISATLLAWLMLTTIMPKFELMFRQFDASLPWFTRQVLSLSHQMQRHTLLFLFLSLLTITLLRLLYRHISTCRLITEKFIVYLPVFGKLFTETALIRCCRTLASCYHCGIPILESIQNAQHVAGLMYYEHAFTRVIQQVSGGTPLYTALRQTQCFPEFMIQMVMVGEESDNLDDMLSRVAEHYECRIDQMVDHLGQLIEPFIIILLGVIVGGLIIAMYLPLFNLMTIVG
ncbi:Type II secretion system protein F [Vibrio aerogenes CECT 7868]|uniref:Type II secretion system protein F n=1 Tax=Vibrio aerogenes CECT 7868 TaxID=1216006 RepID=A0A1M5YHL4_9VIBR|nr:type II secretion system F family protein [Vibrio aerogenes]SHI10993.1 Type II secretion system protein F [Vibrio aerogenes CECT 7868]